MERHERDVRLQRPRGDHAEDREEPRRRRAQGVAQRVRDALPEGHGGGPREEVGREGEALRPQQVFLRRQPALGGGVDGRQRREVGSPRRRRPHAPVHERRGAALRGSGRGRVLRQRGGGAHGEVDAGRSLPALLQGPRPPRLREEGAVAVRRRRPRPHEEGRHGEVRSPAVLVHDVSRGERDGGARYEAAVDVLPDGRERGRPRSPVDHRGGHPSLPRRYGGGHQGQLLLPRRRAVVRLQDAQGAGRAPLQVGERRRAHRHHPGVPEGRERRAQEDEASKVHRDDEGGPVHALRRAVQGQAGQGKAVRRRRAQPRLPGWGVRAQGVQARGEEDYELQGVGAVGRKGRVHGLDREDRGHGLRRPGSEESDCGGDRKGARVRRGE
mmetsp:Transcript_3959/g.7490  ORF Transcript_3959/g.7490 Transcript_3959/m.7490 type:complete len:384 (-) Transcript_3959:98-1249(-)